MPSALAEFFIRNFKTYGLYLILLAALVSYPQQSLNFSINYLICLVLFYNFYKATWEEYEFRYEETYDMDLAQWVYQSK